MDGTPPRVVARFARVLAGFAPTSVAVVGVAWALSTSAAAAELAPLPRYLSGTLQIASTTGADCAPLAAGEARIEVALGAPARDVALVAFDDGNVVRGRYEEGVIAIERWSPIAVAESGRPEGVAVALGAPATELCRWTGVLRVSEREHDADRIARLVALDAANTAFGEASAAMAKGAAAEATPVYERVAQSRAALLGSEHPLVLRTRIRMARALQLAGKATAAREEVEKVVATEERLHGADTYDAMRMRMALGTMLWAEGRPQDALPVVRRAHAELRDRVGAGHLETLLTQNNLALILWDLGRLAEAAAELEFQLPRVVAIQGESHPRALDAMNNLGLIYQGLGRHSAALELLERAYRISVTSLGREHPDTIGTLMSVGTGYAQLDRMEDALAIYRVCHAAWRRSLGDDHPWTLTAQSNVLAALLDLMRADEARPIADDLVQRAERAMGPTHVYTLRWTTMLGGVLFQLRDFAEAARRYERVNAEQEKTLGADHPDTIESLSNLAQSLYNAGERARGAAMAARALADLRRVRGPADRVTLTALVAYADIMAAENRRDEAIAALRELVGAVEKLRLDEGLARETRQAFFARWSGGYKKLALLHGPREPAEAFRMAELSKARTLLESLALRSADMAGIVGTDDAARLATLEARASELTHAMAQAGRSDEAFKIETERNALLHEAAGVRRELRARYPRYAELSEVELVDAKAVASLARPGETLVSYLVAEDEVLAFVARAGRPLVVRSLGRLAHLDATIKAYRTLVAGPLANDPLPVWQRADGSFSASLERPADATSRVTEAAVVGRSLSLRLVQPLRALLAGSRRVVVSPDGALAALPFETLPVGGRPWIASRELSYVQSLSVLAVMRARPGLAHARSTLLAMGAPRFSASASADAAASTIVAEQLTRGSLSETVARSYELRGLRWSELPGAEREIESVARLFAENERVVATGDKASEARLHAMNASGELARFRYLLFATHGHLDTEVPARSALVLSQVDDDRRFDGYLTAAKWPAYRLRSELAVLSACETGLGRQLQGEGVMGLPYAMFVAGNRATILTLWRIDDEATTAFVTEVFRRVRAGARPSSALAAAKRSFVMQSGARASPAIWAPFVLYGD